MRRPHRARVHRGRDLPGGRRRTGCHERRDARVLGVGRLPRRSRTSAFRSCAATSPDEYLTGAGPRAPSRRPVRAPRGQRADLPRLGQEAALRMLMNNLDPEVAEDPDHLVVYGGTGRAAGLAGVRRDRPRAAGARRRRDAPIQSGKPVGVCGPTRGRRACSSPTRTSSASGRPGTTSATSSARA